MVGEDDFSNSNEDLNNLVVDLTSDEDSNNLVVDFTGYFCD
jgi:hypothetical protein